MNWDGGLLTDSGGFQMVSLMALSKVTEEGVFFNSPFDNSRMLLTPEKSIEIQNSIGADIIMQLDDVVAPTTADDRLEEAMWRSIRWLDRCITVIFLWLIKGTCISRKTEFISHYSRGAKFRMEKDLYSRNGQKKLPWLCNRRAFGW
jgi:hypothetical protein